MKLIQDRLDARTVSNMEYRHRNAQYVEELEESAARMSQKALAKRASNQQRAQNLNMPHTFDITNNKTFGMTTTERQVFVCNVHGAGTWALQPHVCSRLPCSLFCQLCLPSSSCL